MPNTQKRNCSNCPFGTTEICELSGDKANKRGCIPSLRFPKALEEWVTTNPENPHSTI